MMKMKEMTFKSVILNSTRYLALKFSIISSLFILVSFLVIGKFYYENYLDTFLTTHKDSFSYWMQIGDEFQLERALSDLEHLNDLRLRVLDKDKNELYRIGNKSFFSVSKQILLRDETQNLELGMLEVGKEIHIIELLIYLTLVMLFNFGLSYFLLKNLNNLGTKLSDPIEKLTKEIQHKKSINSLEHLDARNEYVEINYLKTTLQSLAKRLGDSHKELVKLEKAEQGRKIAKQVAHDIRSPLSALDMLMNDMDDIPEMKRVLIKSSVNRIHDIANDLLFRNSEQVMGNDKVTKYLISDLLESIISEKRLALRDKQHIVIETKFDSTSFGLFAKVNQIEFKRSISNLLNNSIEALEEDEGVVSVTLFLNSDNCIEIQIIDNGKGIPTAILGQLGEEGQTFGKVNGSGLGLSHTKKVFKSWGGTFRIESVEKLGTTIRLTLPKEKVPSTFVDAIRLNHDSHIAIVDDDKSIHDIWDNRISALNINCKIHHFYTPSDFITWVQKKSTKTSLIDFEFIGCKENGLDIIQSLGLQENTFLVTSRYEEEAIIKSCEKLNIGLIPKRLAGFIPIIYEEAPQAVLIDDDKLIHMAWEMEAKKHGVKFQSFVSVSDFMQKQNEIPMNAKIYIDSNLSDGLRGEVESEIIFDAGYTNLYLATGYAPADIDRPHWIKEVVGKRPLF